MAKILLAEDDPNLGFMIEDNLMSSGHEVSWCENGMDALTKFKSDAFEICVLDVMMPKMDGFELASCIRKENEFIPIIFLTAKSKEEDKLAGFEIGGDDYITKPFSIKELEYRINVFLRRSTKQASSDPAKKIGFGQSQFDEKNLIYQFKGEKKSMTQMEGHLLGLLLRNKNELVKREEILEKIWGENDYFKGRSLDVFITRLRKYIKNDERLEIRNHHGVGFSLMEIND